MQIKNQNFNVALSEDSVIEFGNLYAASDKRRCTPKRQIGYPCFTADTDPTTGVVTTNNYTVPGGSVIKIRFRANRSAVNIPNGAEHRQWIWEQTFVASKDYSDLRFWYNGDNINIALAIKKDCLAIKKDCFSK